MMNMLAPMNRKFLDGPACATRFPGIPLRASIARSTISEPVVAVLLGVRYRPRAALGLCLLL